MQQPSKMKDRTKNKVVFRNKQNIIRAANLVYSRSEASVVQWTRVVDSCGFESQPGWNSSFLGNTQILFLLFILYFFSNYLA